MKKALHNLSHEKLLTCNQGELIPLTIMDVVPGDVFRQSTSLLLRTQPLLAPVMHKCNVTIHHWFVPLRLLWADFETFITGGPSGEDASVFPTITVNTGTGWAINSLADYLGLPTGVDDFAASALPFRAYDMIWNNFYRDKDLQTELVISTASGADTTTSTVLQNGCWEKDYFTSARLTPQKGDDVSIPLTGDAPVRGILVPQAANAATGSTMWETPTDSQPTGTRVWSSGVTPYVNVMDAINSAGTAGTGGHGPDIYAEMDAVSAIDINTLRLASALQRFKELMSRFGSSYDEYLRQFGVKAQDSRLQLPEYLGGGSNVIQFSEVLQTAEGTDPVGELRGHGISAAKSNRYKFFAPEHGFILTFLIVRPRTVYMEGIPKLWNRRSRYDYFHHAFQNLGQQEVINKELYAAYTTPEGVFGYQDRYDEYRRIENSVAGEFRSTLNFWHMARDFTSSPALNASFVSSNPTNRIYATAADQLQIRAMHHVKAKRPVSKVAKPYLY